MKVQTTVLLLCFLSGLFVSVVQAKPSPALMRELIALEKYLEKKEGSDSLNENPGEKPIDQTKSEGLLGQNDGHQKEQVEENQPTGNEQNKPNNENNNNVGGEANTPEGSSDADLGVPFKDKNGKPKEQGGDVAPANPEDDVPSKNGEEKSGHSVPGEEAPPEEEGSTASGGEGEEEKPQEGNRPSPSGGQEVKGRDHIYEVLNEATIKIKGSLDILGTLDEDIRKQFQNDDLKLKELKDNDDQRKEKTKAKFGELKTVVEDLKSVAGVEDKRSVGKKSVPDNAPARRSQISDTEFINKIPPPGPQSP